ncbi:MAG: DUF1997 domain-containing protein [Oscillatoria sp. SIO1A7]|nr:DUF1997 domain-containing protein [Oscillatoria sp. SIO1A7]
MLSRFFASQSLEIAVPEQPVPIQHYLRQPQRLVGAIADPSRIQLLGRDRFRLKMRSRDFLMLKIQPIVDLRVWAKSDGTIHLVSVGCEIRGVEYLNRRFALDLVGKLSPVEIGGLTYLRGKADLTVEVEIPAPLQFTPAPVLETTGNGLLKSVLLAIKQKLMHQLLLDYRHWASGEVARKAIGSKQLAVGN